MGTLKANPEESTQTKKLEEIKEVELKNVIIGKISSLAVRIQNFHLKIPKIWLNYLKFSGISRSLQKLIEN